MNVPGLSFLAEIVSMEFGSCCKDLKDALTVVPQPSFWVDEHGILYLTVGRQASTHGPAFYDAAALFCPFCGTAIQSREEIHAKVAHLADTPT